MGYGLFIGHGGPLIVNPTTVIGNNANLSQFTKIGANGRHQAAVIGINVYIGQMSLLSIMLKLAMAIMPPSMQVVWSPKIFLIMQQP